MRMKVKYFYDPSKIENEKLFPWEKILTQKKSADPLLPLPVEHSGLIPFLMAVWCVTAGWSVINWDCW